jgi:malate dehydrogenase (oxaloacetate-decarboxylating)
MAIGRAGGDIGAIDIVNVGNDYIIPSVFDKRVAEAVAREVEAAAYATGVARRDRGTEAGDA